MPNFLPPVVVEILAKADSAYTTMDKVATSAMKTADKVIAEAKRQAEEQVKAAAKADAAAQASADKAAAAAEKHAAAVAKRIEAEQKAAQATAEAEGQVTAAVEKAQAAVEKAAAAEAKAFEASATAAQKASDLQIIAAEKASAAEEAQTGIVEAQAAKRKTLLKAAGDAAGKVGTIGAGAVALVAGVSGEMAAKFEQSTTKLVTSAGESEDSIQSVRDGILGISSDIGVSSGDLSDAMYKVESAGYHGAAGLGLLRAATEGAKAEGADATKVSDALSSAMRDYYPHAQSAADVTKASTDVMSKFIGATSTGKMTFDDLSGSLNNILPAASTAGIGLNDVLGVLSSMTVHGISAQQASENINDAIRHLQNPTQTMAKAMASLGVDSTEVSQKLGERGLAGTMQYLSEKVKAAMPEGAQKVIVDLGNALSKSSPQVQELGQKLMDGSISMAQYNKAAKALDPISAGQAMQFETLAKSTHQIGNKMLSGADVLQTYGGTMAKVMGDATGLKVALMTTGENTGYTNDAIKTISDSTADASGKVKGYAESQNTLATNLDKAKASIANAAIALGTALAPAIKIVADVATGFANWAEKNPQLLAIVVGAVAALSAVLLVFAGVMAIVNLVLAPEGLIVLAIVAAIAVLIAIIVLLWMNWDNIVKWISGVWGGFVNWLRDIMNGFVSWWNGIWGSITKFVSDAWNSVVNWLQGAINGFMGWWSPIWATISAVAAGVWDVILTAGKIAVALIGTLIIGPIRAALNILGAAFDWLYKNAIKPVWDAISKAIGDAWRWVESNVFKPIGDAIDLMGKAWDGFLHNVIEPVWNGISKAIGDAWNWVVQNVATAIKNEIDGWNNLFTWLWKNVIEPVWQGIQKAIGDAWQWLVDNVFKPVGDTIDSVQKGFQYLYDNVIKPVWDSIQKAIGDAWTWISDNVFTPIHNALDALGKAFGTTKDLISTAWDDIKSAASGPVHFIVDKVYTEGIEKTWNDIASSVGLDLKLPDVKLGFASGGIMPGYTPGTDNQLIAVSGGEAIMRPEWTRAVGADRIHAMNAMARSGDTAGIQGMLGLSGFADGGIVGFITDVASHIGDFLSNPGKAIGDMIKGPMDAMKGSVGGGNLGQMLFQFPEKIVGGLIDKAKSLVSSVVKPASGGGGGSVGSPGAVSGDLASWIGSAMSAVGVAGGNWLNGLETIAMHESGGNPTATNNWDSNAAAGDPSRGIMQTIGSTFEAYRLASLPDDIFNPVANIAAGIRYIESRYGDISNVPGLVSMAQGGGYVGYSTGGVVPTLYDNGGWLPQGVSVVENRSGRPEPVFTGSQFDRMQQSAPANRVQNVSVYATTNASAHQIASEVGWALRNQN